MPITIISDTTQARSAAERFKKEYERGTYWEGPQWDGITGEDRYQQLLALGPNPTPEQVETVLPRGGWSRAGRCDSCRNDASVLAECGEIPDYESCTARLCKKCLKEALQKLKEQEKLEK